MPAASPPLSAEQVTFLEDASSILVGTCDATGRPEGVRAVGIRAHAGGMRVSVLIPSSLAARTLDNLTAAPRIAVTTAAVPTYNTIQLKGLARGVRDAEASDCALAERFQDRFEAEFAWAAALARSRRVVTWPCKVIDVDIETLYLEAPAPLEFPTGRSRS